MYTVVTCPLCDQRYRIQPWPMPNVLRHSRIVFALPCGHQRFSVLAIELDTIKSLPQCFPQTAQIAEVRPPDPQVDASKFRRNRARPIVQFE